MPVHRLFEYTAYDDVRRGCTKRWQRWLAIPRYRALGGSTVEALASLFAATNVTHRDHLLVVTTDWLMLKALDALSRRKRFFGNFPRIHLIFMYEQANWMTAAYPYKKMIRAVAAMSARQLEIFIYTETAAHSKNLSFALNAEVAVYPFPSLPPTRKLPLNAHGKLRVSALGGGRRDKGFALLPAIVRSFNRSYTDERPLEFVIQRPRPEDRLTVAERELEGIDNVVLLANRLDQTEYEESLARADIVLLPYERNAYRVRGSGVVNEAVAAGKVILCTEGISLAEQIRCGNGAVATTPNSYARRLVEFVNDWERFQAAAAAAGEAYRRDYFDNALVSRIRGIG